MSEILYSIELTQTGGVIDIDSKSPTPGSVELYFGHIFKGEDGNYTKPSTGIPKSDLNSGVQDILDTALIEPDSDVIAAAIASLSARVEALESRLAPNGNLGDVNIDNLKVIKSFTDYSKE